MNRSATRTASCTSTSCPTIFIHRGPVRWYLWHAVRQVRKFNPADRLILVSDRKFPRFSFVERFALEDFDTSAAQFRRVYRHAHWTPEIFERFNFERWFVLRDLFRACRLKGCVVLDSDTLVYTNLAQARRQYDEFDLTLTRGCSPHALFVKDWKALDRFCGYVQSVYENASSEDDLHNAFEDYVNTSGGTVSDMAAFHHYRLTHPDLVGDNHCILNGACFDNNIHESEGFRMHHGYKRIAWHDGRPHGIRDFDETLVRFHVLHFQGYAKRVIPRYTTHRDWRYRMHQLHLRLRGPLERWSMHLTRD